MRFKCIFFICAILSIASLSFAQISFTVNNSSKIYTAKILVQKCEDETCSGKGTVTLYTKNNSKPVQQFTSKDLYFNLDSDKNPSKKMELYDEQSPLIFGDFNFDE